MSKSVNPGMWAEILGVVAAAILAVVCWNAGRTTSEFAPLIEGAPTFSGTHYDGLWISGAGVSLLLAGLMAINVVRRWRVARVESPEPTYG